MRALGETERYNAPNVECTQSSIRPPATTPSSAKGVYTFSL